MLVAYNITQLIYWSVLWSPLILIPNYKLKIQSNLKLNLTSLLLQLPVITSSSWPMNLPSKLRTGVYFISMGRIDGETYLWFLFPGSRTSFDSKLLVVGRVNQMAVGYTCKGHLHSKNVPYMGKRSFWSGGHWHERSLVTGSTVIKQASSPKRA